jgi:hypothetical protein
MVRCSLSAGKGVDLGPWWIKGQKGGQEPGNPDPGCFADQVDA